MEKAIKMLLVLTVLLGLFTMDAAGTRSLKTFLGGISSPGLPTTFPSPGLPTTFPSPGLPTTFPSPGLPTTFPSPGFSGSFPGPGFSGSFPSPGLGFGPSSFCSFPGVRCSPVQPSIGTVPHGADGNGSP